MEETKILEVGVPGVGVASRDIQVKQEEERGNIAFIVINGKDREKEINLQQLTDLKNIIARQLPKMPKEYIVRLIFDKNHESMLIMRERKVIGGVCYRPNKEEKFIEIAFLAISSLEQVKGFGTRLMNKLKDHCRYNQYEYMITYADNNAIGI